MSGGVYPFPDPSHARGPAIDDATYEAALRRPWHVPGAHERIEAERESDTPYADDYEAALASQDGGEPNFTIPTVDVGAKRGVQMLAGVLVAAFVVAFTWVALS